MSSFSMMPVISLATSSRVLAVGSDGRSMANTQRGARGSPGETQRGDGPNSMQAYSENNVVSPVGKQFYSVYMHRLNLLTVITAGD